jgi:hypothetical protein
MSAELGSAIAVLLVTAICASVLRTLGVSFLPPVICLGVALALSLFTDELAGSVESLLSLSAFSDISYYLDGAVRVIGVGYLSSLCKESCDALGEGALARAATLVGRIEIVIISLPFFIEIFEMGVGMLS